MKKKKKKRKKLTAEHYPHLEEQRSVVTKGPKGGRYFAGLRIEPRPYRFTGYDRSWRGPPPNAVKLNPVAQTLLGGAGDNGRGGIRKERGRVRFPLNKPMARN